jgi:hypothetical protein
MDKILFPHKDLPTKTWMLFYSTLAKYKIEKKEGFQKYIATIPNLKS